MLPQVRHCFIPCCTRHAHPHLTEVNWVDTLNGKGPSRLLLETSLQWEGARRRRMIHNMKAHQTSPHGTHLAANRGQTAARGEPL